MSNLIRGISENGGVVFCGVDSRRKSCIPPALPAARLWGVCSPECL